MKVVSWVHLWAGLISGLVVLIICLTGCLFVFQKEISDQYYKNIFFVAPQTTTLPLSRLQRTAQEALGKDQPVNNITVYRDPQQAWEFMAYRFNDTAITYFGGTDYYRSVFINPYTGTVTGFRNYKTDFFTIVKYLHWSLLLNTKYGQPIVGWSTLVFTVLLLTGLVLWWPKKWNRATRRISFSIKWKAGFKRLNYDLHNVLGFYSLCFALVLALTGMIWSFQWFYNLVYQAAGIAKPAAAVQSGLPVAGLTPLDTVYAVAVQKQSNAKRINITPAFDPTGPIDVYAYNGRENYYDYNNLKFDQYTGQLLQEQSSSGKSGGERLMEMNYDIHVGAIGGLPGKILAFIASLIAASLPVTGFYVWWHKRRKRKKEL